MNARKACAATGFFAVFSIRGWKYQEGAAGIPVLEVVELRVVAVPACAGLVMSTSSAW
jgi:hypothetical protein